MRVWMWAGGDHRPDPLNVADPVDPLEVSGKTLRRFETQLPADRGPCYVYGEVMLPAEIFEWVRTVEGYLRRGPK
jgi:hypothetical protein